MVMSAAAVSRQPCTVRTLWPISRPMSQNVPISRSSARARRRPGSAGSSTSRSMSEHGIELAAPVAAGRDQRGRAGGFDLRPDFLDRAVDELRVPLQQQRAARVLQVGLAQRRAPGRDLLAQGVRRTQHGAHRLAESRAGAGTAPAEVVSTSTPLSVTATVCSHCADRLWSLVTMVQPSASSRMPACRR